MHDPIPDHGGILTREELAACVRVLRRFEQPTQTLAVTEFDATEQRVWVALWRAGYLREFGSRVCRRGDSFQWDRAVITDDGRAWLAQIAGTTDSSQPLHGRR